MTYIDRNEPPTTFTEVEHEFDVAIPELERAAREVLRRARLVDVLAPDGTSRLSGVWVVRLETLEALRDALRSVG